MFASEIFGLFILCFTWNFSSEQSLILFQMGRQDYVEQSGK